MIQMAQRHEAASLIKDQSILNPPSMLKSSGFHHHHHRHHEDTTSLHVMIADQASSIAKRHLSETQDPNSSSSSSTSNTAKRKRAMSQQASRDHTGKAAARDGGTLLARGGSRQAAVLEEDGFVASAATENTVVVIGMNPGCCMCHVATRLLCSLGVNPTVIDVGAQHTEAALEAALRRKLGSHEIAPSSSALIPAVFIGGRLLGGVDSLLSAHISGHLIPQLKEAGALWL